MCVSLRHQPTCLILVVPFFENWTIRIKDGVGVMILWVFDRTCYDFGVFEKVQDDLYGMFCLLSAGWRCYKVSVGPGSHSKLTAEIPSFGPGSRSDS